MSSRICLSLDVNPILCPSIHQQSALLAYLAIIVCLCARESARACVLALAHERQRTHARLNGARESTRGSRLKRASGQSRALANWLIKCTQVPQTYQQRAGEERFVRNHLIDRHIVNLALYPKPIAGRRGSWLEFGQRFGQHTHRQKSISMRGAWERGQVVWS